MRKNADNEFVKSVLRESGCLEKAKILFDIAACVFDGADSTDNLDESIMLIKTAGNHGKYLKNMKSH